MINDNKVISESLNAEQERTLISLLALIIPPSEDGKMPGAAEVGFPAGLTPWLRTGLLSLGEEARSKLDREFSALSAPEQMQIIDGSRSRLAQFYSRLTALIVQYYYQQDRVLLALGLEVRPPFPLGYHLDSGDLTLLEPVYERGQLYRDVTPNKGGPDVVKK
jgi:hypothetical protein